MSYAIIKKLLNDKIGLDSESIGSSILESVVRARMQSVQVDTLEEYLSVVSSSAAELGELIDNMTIPETWFFRDYAPFEKLRQFALAYYAKERSGEPLRILSLPSSTGEEPYSIAMTMCDLGIPASRFVINAIDICKKSIGMARKGIYSPHSFRCKQREEIIGRYFSVEGKSHILSDRIKGMVQFSLGNIIDPALSLPFSSYHVIFCRNLLIYFDTTNKNKAYTKLESLLHEDGILFIGHSEAGSIPKEMFTYTGVPKAFAYTRTQHDMLQTIQRGHSCKSRITVTRGKWAPSGSTRPVRSRPFPRTTPLHQAPTAASVPEQQPQSGLEAAKIMANQGEFSAAERICRDLLQQDNNCPDAYCLLGLIKASSNRMEEAEEYLRKAIYLKPRYYDALIHLSLLLDKKGAGAEASLLKKRAERAAS